MGPPEAEPLAPSATDLQRVVCEHADRCGGCPVIALSYGEQLALKRGRVVQSAARYASLELVYTEPVVPAEPIVSYRTRAKLIVAPGGRVGLFAKGGGHQVVDIPSCRVLSPVLAKVADLLRARITADEEVGGPLAPYDGGLGERMSLIPGLGPGVGAQPQGRALRALDLREVRQPAPSEGARADDAALDSARVLVTLVVQRSRVGNLDGLRAAAANLAQAAPEIIGIAVNMHEGDAPQILGGETVHLWGVTSAHDSFGRSKHLATFGSFVQAHRGQAGRVHSILAESFPFAKAKSEGRLLRVLDLYGGSGAIALGLAREGAEVHLVESFAPAVQQAQAAADAQGLKVRAECADTATALKGAEARGEKVDAAVVNPPRRGMSALAREWLARVGPEIIAYVSCDPDTLARDLDHFHRIGYAATLLRPLDMIPLTDEVETIAVLKKAPVPPPRVAFEDDEILIVDKGPHEPTSPQGEYAGSLHARVRRIPGAERAVPIHRIDVGTSGLVIFAKSQELVPRWTEALAAPMTRKIYVAATRGVTPSKGAITRELREDGKLFPARTRYRRLAVASGHSVLRVIPEQGRTHQIRRHLAAIGHPVLGDDRYGHAPTNRFFEEKNGLDRAFLHCVRIEIDHPDATKPEHVSAGKPLRLVVEAPLPGDLRAVLERTSGPGTLRFLDHKNALGTSGFSTMPPPPDSLVSVTELPSDRGSALDVDTHSVTIHPQMMGDDDDGGREPGF
jgi:23S rRNA (uracil1939-C5)-methyltransferase